MKKITAVIFPEYKRVSFLAALFSVLATACTAFFRMHYLYQKTPEYKELVTGYTSWIGYFKEGDMTLAYHVIFGIVLFYLLFSFLLNLLAEKILFLRKQREEVSLTEKEREGILKISQLFFLLVFTQFSWGVIGKGIVICFPSLHEILTKGFFIVQLLLAAGVCLFWFYAKKAENEKLLEGVLSGSQLLLPLVFPAVTRYEYEYGGNLVLQYSSAKFTFFCVAISIILLVLLFFEKKKTVHTKVYLSSFLSLAVFASYQLPRGTISGAPLEFYHYGELSVPLQQFLHFGTVPYLDTMPIHGVCDYFQAGIWYLFFDGTYASFEAAMVMGCVVIAVITALVFYFCVDSKAVGILCILWFSLFGDQYYYVRWAFVLPFIMLVFSKKSREDFSRMLFYWVFLSILSIAWNPSIGGTCSLAALPFIFYKAFNEKGYLVFARIWKEKDYRKKWILPYGFLLVLGVSFIPMFFDILRYITENSAAILETTGDILKEELAEPFVWYASFGFVIPLLCSFYFCVGKRGEERKLAIFGALFLLLFNGIIVKYTFVRTQFGERGIIAVTISSLFLILMVLLPCVKARWKRQELGLLLFLLLLTGVTKGADLSSLPGKLLIRESIPQTFAYVEGEKIGIPSLGNIYMEKKLKEEFISLNHIANELCGEEFQFVDMTNQLSHYTILDKKVLLPFSSTYNTNNEVMQTKAIQVLNDLKPEVIVVSPEWRHDAGALSTRNYHLYQWLMQHDYTPCKYESILFLTNNPGIREQYASAYEELGQIMHLEEIKMLPTVWAGQKLKEHNMEKTETELLLADTNSQVLSDGYYQIEGEDTFFLYTLAEPVSGKEIDFLRIRAEFLNVAEDCIYQGVVYFMEEGKGIKESRRFIYDGGAREVVIPLSTSPYWSYSDKNQMIMVNFIGSQLTGTQVNLELEFEKYTGPGRDQK